MVYETGKIYECISLDPAHSVTIFRDQNGFNFVYHQKNGHHQAEIVDWARVEHLGTHPKVAPMHIEPVHMQKPGRKCPTCVVQ